MSIVEARQVARWFRRKPDLTVRRRRRNALKGSVGIAGFPAAAFGKKQLDLPIWEAGTLISDAIAKSIGAMQCRTIAATNIIRTIAVPRLRRLRCWIPFAA